MKVFYLLFFILSFGFLQQSNAQIYSRIDVPSGVQTIRNNAVTVTPSGVATGGQGGFRVCNADPYSIGLNYNGNPGSFRFDFSVPVTKIRIPISATNIGELNSIFINGIKYIITSANLDSLNTCDTQYRHQNVANATGDVVYVGPVVASSSYYGRFGSSLINIEFLAGINSVRFDNNGVMGGSVIGFYFMGVPIFASNNSKDLCLGDTLRLSGTPETPNAFYSWIGPAGFTSNLRNPIIPNTALKNEGIYTCTVTTPFDTASDTTYVKFKPLPIVDSIADIEVCLGDTITVSASANVSGAMFHWNGPGIVGSTSNLSIENIQDINSGVYSVTATASGCNSKPEQFRITVVKPVLGPTNTVFICQGEEYNYKGKALTAAGVYADTLKGQSSKGCDSIIFLNLQFDPIPNTKIANIPEGPICLGDSITLEGSGASDYTWYMDDDYLGVENRISIILPQLSNQIILRGTNQYDCKKSDTVTINTIGCCAVFMPTAFSPNMDGLNDFYGPKVDGHIESFQMKIYNRWGQLMYAGYDVNSNWDGKFKGADADVGVYFYSIGGKCLRGEKINKKCDFLLIK